MYREIEGNLITLAQQGNFDVISHGCNCQSKMGAGIAPQMAKAFGCNEYHLELLGPDIDKLGRIDYQMNCVFESNGKLRIYNPLVERLNFSLDGWKLKRDMYVVNSYTQFMYGNNHKDGVTKPLDYEALTLCMRKINYRFNGMEIGLPYVIGCGLAGGEISIVLPIIQKELKDMNITMVKYIG